MTRNLWRVLLKLRFTLWQRHRHDRLVLEKGLGYPLVVLPGVFNPTLFLTTRVLVSYLDEHPFPGSCTVLDLGTGSGALAVAAARTARRVIAADVNPEAVRCARLNFLLNRCDDRAVACHGDLFDAVASARFDRVLCNPPFYRGSPCTDLERAFLAEDFAERFAAGLPGYLADRGCALVVLSSEGDQGGFLNAFRRASLKVAEVARVRQFGEVIQIFRLAKEPDALSDLP